jgi:hypothetical protein
MLSRCPAVVAPGLGMGFGTTRAIDEGFIGLKSEARDSEKRV